MPSVNNVTLDEYNPNTQYYLIKQNLININSNLNEIDEFMDKTTVKNIEKLDLFRSIMQYSESFLLFFIAKIKNETSMEYISNIKIEAVLKACDYFKLNRFDKYVEDESLEYDDFNDLIKQVFNLNNPNKFGEIKKILANITYFYEYYKDAYNSFKHGLRIVERKITHVDIDLLTHPLRIREDYVEIFCNYKQKFYSLIIPVDLLFNDSKEVLEDIHEIFNFLMKKNNYQTDLDFEYISQTTFSTDYVRITNDKQNYSIILAKFNELKKLHSTIYDYHYAKLNFNGNTKVTITVNDEPSYDYPFNILLNKDQMNLEPTQYISDILIDHSLILNPSQMNILKNISKEIDLNNQLQVEFEGLDAMTASPTINISISENLKEFNENIIKGLKIFEQFLENPINIPYNLTEKTKEEIIEFKNSSTKSDRYHSLYETLKTQNNQKEECYLIIWKKHKIADYKYLGYSFNTNNYQVVLEDRQGKKYELTCNHKIKLSCNIKILMEVLKNTFKNGESLNELNKYSLENSFYLGRITKKELEFKENILIFNLFMK